MSFKCAKFGRRKFIERTAPGLTFAAMPFAPLSIAAAAPPSGTKEGKKYLNNPFFAMNFAVNDPRYASAQAHAELLKENGYDGELYLGPLSGLSEAFRAMDAAGLRVFMAAVQPYDVFIDPGQSYPAHLKDAIQALKGRETVLIIQFQSKTHARGSEEGDERAVEIARELADYARGYGVRVAIYPHAHIWCERIDHATRIARKCNRDNFGVIFNERHWRSTDPAGDLKSLVREAMPYIFAMTIEGSSLGEATGTRGNGVQDVAGFTQVFIAAGYKGPIGAQFHGARTDPRENLRRAMEGWRRISAWLATG